MSTIQQQVASKFITRLSESKKVDPTKIEQLDALLSNVKKPKAEEFVKIFSQPIGGDLK